MIICFKWLLIVFADPSKSVLHLKVVLKVLMNFVVLLLGMILVMNCMLMLYEQLLFPIVVTMVLQLAGLGFILATYAIFLKEKVHIKTYPKYAFDS